MTLLCASAFQKDSLMSADAAAGIMTILADYPARSSRHWCLHMYALHHCCCCCLCSYSVQVADTDVRCTFLETQGKDSSPEVQILEYVSWLLFYRFVQPCLGCQCLSRTAIPFSGAATCGCTMAWSVCALLMLADKPGVEVYQ